MRTFHLFARSEETPDETETDETETEKTDIAVVATAQETGDILRISPRARNLALKTGADLSKAAPTGPMGRIIERDVNRILDDGNVVPTERVEKYLSGERDIPEETETVIAENIATTAPEVPAESAVPETTVQEMKSPGNGGSVHRCEAHEHTPGHREVGCTRLSPRWRSLLLNTSFDASAILAYRARVKARGRGAGAREYNPQRYGSLRLREVAAVA